MPGGQLGRLRHRIRQAAGADRRLARTMRWATVGSETRNARAISPVDSPPTSRSVSATWLSGASAG